MDFCLPPEHDPGGEYTALIGERACAASLFGNVPHGTDADAVPFSLGRAEDAAFLHDLAVKGILDFNQQQPLGVKIRRDPEPPVWHGAETGLQGVFQKIRQHKAHVDFINRKGFRQIELGAEGDVLPFARAQ